LFLSLILVFIGIAGKSVHILDNSETSGICKVKAIIRAIYRHVTRLTGFADISRPYAFYILSEDHQRLLWIFIFE